MSGRSDLTARVRGVTAGSVAGGFLRVSVTVERNDDPWEPGDEPSLADVPEDIREALRAWLDGS